MKKIILILTMVMTFALTFTMTNVSAYEEVDEDGLNWHYTKMTEYEIEDGKDVLSESVEITRDSAGNILTWTSYYPDESGKLALSYKKEYTYYKDNLVKTYQYSESKDGVGLVNKNFEEYTYNEQDQLTEKIEYQYPDEVKTPVTKYSYSYNSNGYVKNVYEYEYDGEYEDFKNKTSTIYFYDSNNNVIEIEIYDISEGAPKVSRNTKYQYNEKNLVTLETILYYDSSETIYGKNYYENKYDEQGRLIEYSHKSYDGTETILKSSGKDTYSYDGTTETKITYVDAVSGKIQRRLDTTTTDTKKIKLYYDHNSETGNFEFNYGFLYENVIENGNVVRSNDYKLKTENESSKVLTLYKVFEYAKADTPTKTSGFPVWAIIVGVVIVGVGVGGFILKKKNPELFAKIFKKAGVGLLNAVKDDEDNN